MQTLKPHKPKEASKQKYYRVDTRYQLSHKMASQIRSKNGQELGNEPPENTTTPLLLKAQLIFPLGRTFDRSQHLPLALGQALPMSVPFLVGVSMIHLGPCPNCPGGRNKETLAPFLSTVGGGASSTRLHNPGGPLKEREEDLEFSNPPCAPPLTEKQNPANKQNPDIQHAPLSHYFPETIRFKVPILLHVIIP